MPLSRKVSSLALYSPGGDFFIFLYEGGTGSKAAMWRRDHHAWATRAKNTQAVREDQMRLKLDGQEFAVCAYTKAQDVESFRRRAYWLKEDPRHVLVHYLDEAGKY